MAIPWFVYPFPWWWSFVLVLVASGFGLFTYKASMNISVQLFVWVYIFFISWVNTLEWNGWILRVGVGTVPSNAFLWFFLWPWVLRISITLPARISTLPRVEPCVDLRGNLSGLLSSWNSSHLGLSRPCPFPLETPWKQ